MAYEADKVVVTLLAENDQFDAAAKASAANYAQSMGQIQSSGAAAEKGVGQFSSALKANRLELNQSRIGMMEFQHIARGTADQIAAGAPATQILTQHLGMLGEAVALSGGAFGKFGEFLMGPWGIALTLAVVVGGKLLANLLDQKYAVDATYDKLVKQKEQTELNAEAEDRWSHTLDGLIDQTKHLREELDKRVQTQSALNDQLQRTVQLKYAESLNAEAQLEARGASPDLIAKVESQIADAARALHESQQVTTETIAQQSTDLNVAAAAWIDAQRRMMEQITGEHPELVNNEAIQAAVDLFDKATKDAASAKMPFGAFTSQVHALDTSLLNGSISADAFAQKVRGLASELTKSTAAFQNQDSAISKFKQAIIGAEGTGANKMGSSAAGYGQFMPATFEYYYKQAYGNPGNLSNQQIDALRNNRTVAEGVIATATDDYVRVLKAAGQQITEAALYTMHMLSAGDPHGTVALRLLNAPAGVSARSIVGSRVVAQNGNIFTGTAGQARDAIASRIGDSNSAVSSGAAAVTAELTKQADLWQKINDDVQGALTKNIDISDELKHQSDLVPRITADELLDKGALEQIDELAKQITAQEEALKQMGDQFVEDVLNPDNWTSFGSIAHTVLMDIMKDLERLAVLNPIENWINGNSNLPTLGSLAGLFGGGGGTTLNLDLPLGYATGGAFKVNGGIDTNLLSINGQPRAMVSSDETIAVIPNNATAASPLAAAQSLVRFVVEASPYFDGRVAEVSGPIAVQAGTRGAYAGAGMARNNLARRQMHQLGNV